MWHPFPPRPRAGGAPPRGTEQPRGASAPAPQHPPPRGLYAGSPPPPPFAAGVSANARRQRDVLPGSASSTRTVDRGSLPPLSVSKGTRFLIQRRQLQHSRRDPGRHRLRRDQERRTRTDLATTISHTQMLPEDFPTRQWLFPHDFGTFSDGPSSDPDFDGILAANLARVPREAGPGEAEPDQDRPGPVNIRLTLAPPIGAPTVPSGTPWGPQSVAIQQTGRICRPPGPTRADLGATLVRFLQRRASHDHRP